MAKNDGSGLKAGYTTLSQEEQDAITRRREEGGQEMDDQSVPKKADPSTDDSPKPAPSAEEASGPVMTMQGVSGKKIQSTVKVVKVSKKASEAPAPSAAPPAAEAPAGAPAAQPAEAAPAAAPAAPAAAEAPATPAPAARAPQTEAAPAARPAAARREAAPRTARPSAPTPTAPSPDAAAPVSGVGTLPSGPTPRKVGRLEQLPETRPTASRRRVDRPARAVRAGEGRRHSRSRQVDVNRSSGMRGGYTMDPGVRGSVPHAVDARGVVLTPDMLRAQREEARRQAAIEEAAKRRAAAAEAAAAQAAKAEAEKAAAAAKAKAEAQAEAAAPRKLETPTPRRVVSGRDIAAAAAAEASAPAAPAAPAAPVEQPAPAASETPAAPAASARPREAAPARRAEARPQPVSVGPDAPNRGQGPTREAKPSGVLGQPVTPGKVGNIFDRQGAQSSLAATAQAFAQRRRRPPQGAAPGGGRGRPGFGRGPGQRPAPGGPPGGGFMDKDKDADSRQPARGRRTGRRRAPAAPDLFPARPQDSRGASFAQRDAIDRSKRGRSRGRRDEQTATLRELRRERGDQRGARNANIAVLTKVSLPATLTVKELAEALKKTSAEVITKLMGFGVMATMNEAVDYDTAAIIANEFGIKAEQLVEVTEEDILFDDSEDAPEDLEPRPPVVVVMGHVDHGKTSLLDSIRSSRVASGEAGGITQHIGAHMVRVDDRRITFLDTPGHEAFTTMRARGAQATDIAILVVAADDGVMPQTVEAINHARAAETEIIVAINKIDKPSANLDRVYQELSAHNLVPEAWGGDTVMVPVSALTGEGIDELLEMVLLTADLLELRANPNAQAKGIVIEAELDRNRGSVVTMLVQRGTLRTGDTLVTGAIVGNVRAMMDSNGKAVKKAGPSVPVEILGLPEVPEAGELFYVVDDERTARSLADKRRAEQREATIGKGAGMSLDNLFTMMEAGEVQQLDLVVKADVVGSVEAVTQSLTRLSNDEVRINVIHGAVGAITETDVRLAEVSNAIIIGFSVRPSKQVSDLASELGVDIRLYRVIYNAIEDIEAAMKGMLAPTIVEQVTGHVEIRETFHASSIGTIGGGYVTDGRINRNSQVRLLRDGVVIHEGRLASLRRFKDDVREVSQGYELGLSLERFNDIKIGDVVEAYVMQEVERT